MEIQFDLDTWDVLHYQDGQSVKLAYLIEQLLDHFNFEIIDGKLTEMAKTDDQ